MLGPRKPRRRRRDAKNEQNPSVANARKPAMRPSRQTHAQLGQGERRRVYPIAGGNFTIMKNKRSREKFCPLEPNPSIATVHAIISCRRRPLAEIRNPVTPHPQHNQQDASQAPAHRPRDSQLAESHVRDFTALGTRASSPELAANLMRFSCLAPIQRKRGASVWLLSIHRYFTKLSRARYFCLRSLYTPSRCQSMPAN